MYPRKYIYSRPRSVISSRGPQNSQEWSQTQDSQEWVDSQEIMGGPPAPPQMRQQIIRNNHQVVPSSQHLTHSQGGRVGPFGAEHMKLDATDETRELVARDLRYGLHMILNLIKELPEKMKEDLTEVVRSQSSQEEVKTHLQNTKEHFESLFTNLEQKLGKILENTENSQTLNSTLLQQEEMIQSLNKNLELSEEIRNKEQRDWFEEQLQGIRTELKKQLKKCLEGIQSISVEKDLENFTEVLKAELLHLEDTVQNKFKDMMNDNKIQMEMVQRNMEVQLNDLKTFISTKMDDHYDNIKETLPEMVTKHVKCLERCNSRPSPLSDISNRFVSPVNLNISRGYSNEYFCKSSPVATVKPQVKMEPETPRDVLRRNSNQNLIPSSYENQKSFIAQLNVRRPIQTPQLNVRRPIQNPQLNVRRPIQTPHSNVRRPIQTPQSNARPIQTPQSNIRRPILIPKSSNAKNVRKPTWIPQSEVIAHKRICLPEIKFQKAPNNQNTRERKCNEAIFHIQDMSQKLFDRDTQQFNIKISSENTQTEEKKFALAYDNSEDSEDDNSLTLYLTSADEESDPVLLDITTPPSENNLPAIKNVNKTTRLHGVNPVPSQVHNSRTIQEKITNNSDSLLQACNEKRIENIKVVAPVQPMSSNVVTRRQSFKFFTMKNRRNSLY